MLTLNLKTYDAGGNLIPALCIDGAGPQQIQSLFAFLGPKMKFEVTCVETEMNKN